MKALTVQGFWAWLIVHGPKRIENRARPLAHRGELAIHVGRSRRWDAAAIALCQQLGVELPGEIPRGAILGLANVAGCVPATCDDVIDDPWASGPWCIVLDHVRPLVRPVFCPGRQSLWTVPEDLAGQVRRLA